MWDGRSIDNYHLTLDTWCTCMKCKNYHGDGIRPAFSCKIYPEYKGIPKKIWNGDNEYCEYYVRKDA